MAINDFTPGEPLDAARLNELVSQINANDNLSATLASDSRTLQIQEYKVPSVNDNYVAISSAQKWDTPIQLTITPKSATSTLYIEATVQYRIISAYGMSVGFKRDGVDIPGCYNLSGGQSFQYKGDGVNHHFQPTVHASVTSGSTAATTITLFLVPYNGTGEFNYGWGRNSIRITEVEN